MECRRATTQDADELARLFADGIATYTAFAPPGWTGPSYEEEVTELQRLLPDERVWCFVAVEAGTAVGQVMILPTAISRVPADRPGLAHFRNLFVAESHWGTGLAVDLHRAAIQAARERGFTQMRLYTPGRHGRARRFYEREGWVAIGGELDDAELGIPLIEYRYALT